jgi:hypothetical protein
LNNLAVAGLLYLLLRFAARPSATLAYVGSLWCGLALSNQHTAIFFVLPVVLWVLWTGRCSSCSPQYSV